MSKKKFLFGAIVLALGGFLGKAIGAFYRVPLLRILGAEGMGVYQLIFPLYSLLLMLSSVAIPVAVSKMVAERVSVGDDFSARHILFLTIKKFLYIGAILGFVLVACSGLAAKIQGEARAGLSYVIIAPAIVIVCVISAFRGYFQGRQNMYPTAMSQIVEQIVKMFLGLFLAWYFMPNVELAVAGSILAVTISEVVACIYLIVMWKINKTASNLFVPELKSSFFRKDYEGRVLTKKLDKLVLPIIIGAFVLPFSQILDSVMVINILSRYRDDAVNLYGLMTGAVFSFNSLPTAIAFSIAVSCIPLFAKNRKSNFSENMQMSIFLTLLVALPSCFGVFIFSETITRFLYSNLPSNEIVLVSQMFKLASLQILFLSINQTLVAVLQGVGKEKVPVFSIVIAVVIKIALSAILLFNQKIHIFGAIISTNACFFVAGFLNLVYIIKCIGFKFKWLKGVVFPLGMSVVSVAGAYLVYSSFINSISFAYSFLISVFFAILVYALMFLLLFVKKNFKLKF